MKLHWSEISPRFKIEEVFSPDTIRCPHLINLNMLLKLNRLAVELGVPVLVNHNGLRLRGVRSAREQMTLKQTNPGAADLSMHVQGRAVDVTCSIENDKLIEIAKKFGFKFFKIYPTFIHMDDRDNISI